MSGEPEVFPLDDAAIALVAELQREIGERVERLNGVLIYFSRIHGLKGNWMLAPNNRELIRPQQPAGPAGSVASAGQGSLHAP